jgi:hypothetical protein
VLRVDLTYELRAQLWNGRYLRIPAEGRWYRAEAMDAPAVITRDVSTLLKGARPNQCSSALPSEQPSRSHSA